MPHGRNTHPPSALKKSGRKAMAARMAKNKAAAKKKISKRQALMAERVDRGPNKRRTVGQPPNRSMTNKMKGYKKAKSDAIKKGHSGAKKFQQPGGRRGGG